MKVINVLFYISIITSLFAYIFGLVFKDPESKQESRNAAADRIQAWKSTLITVLSSIAIVSTIVGVVLLIIITLAM